MSEISVRSLAAQVLFRVEEQGVFAAAALSQGLQAHKLGPKDKALVTEIVYGSIRVGPYLKRKIQALAKRKQPLLTFCQGPIVGLND